MGEDKIEENIVLTDEGACPNEADKEPLQEENETPVEEPKRKRRPKVDDFEMKITETYSESTNSNNIKSDKLSCRFSVGDIVTNKPDCLFCTTSGKQVSPAIRGSKLRISKIITENIVEVQTLSGVFLGKFHISNLRYY